MRDLRQLRLQSWGGVRKPTSGAVTCHWNRRGTDAAATQFYRPSGRRFERACVPYDDDDNRLLVLKTSSKTIEWIFVVFFLQEPNQDWSTDAMYIDNNEVLLLFCSRQSRGSCGDTIRLSSTKYINTDKRWTKENMYSAVVGWWVYHDRSPPVMKCLESLGKFEKHLETRTGKNDVAITPTHTTTKEKYLKENCTEINQTCSKTNKTTHW